MFDFGILDMIWTDIALLSNDWPDKIYNMLVTMDTIGWVLKQIRW